MPLLLLYTSIS